MCSKENKGIVYFDTGCLYCNRFVIFILDRDKNNYFLFAKVDGELTTELTQTNEDTIIFNDAGKVYKKAKAIMHILDKIGGFYRLMVLPFKLIPQGILDRVYDCFARNRNKIKFSLKCRTLSEQEKAKFFRG